MLYSKSFRRYRARTLTFTVTHSVTYSQMMIVLDRFVNEGKVVRFRLFKMLMRERLKNLTKLVRNSRSNTIAKATPFPTTQRQKRSLWDHVFLTYDEKAQIDSVVKSLDTWRAGEIIGYVGTDWVSPISRLLNFTRNRIVFRIARNFSALNEKYPVTCNFQMTCSRGYGRTNRVCWD
jgi:hypothetical protein